MQHEVNWINGKLSSEEQKDKTIKEIHRKTMKNFFSKE